MTGRAVGQLGGGRTRRTRLVDIAMFQSIARRVEDPGVFDGYGLVVVDECHHVPAQTFERAVRHAPVCRWLGLTATPDREDGLHPLITMQCGPIRTTVARGADPLVRRVVTHESLADPDLGDGASYQDFVTGLALDPERNAAIVADVSAALARGRQCPVLTQRTEHLECLAALLAERGETAYVLRGGMGKRERVAVTAAIGVHPDDQPVLVVATGPYAGEGFDCPRLDTLFLVLPIKAKTKLIQYVGRVMRTRPAKSTVEVHDYDDTLLPIFKAARAARVATYASLGFDVDRQRRR